MKRTELASGMVVAYRRGPASPYAQPMPVTIVSTKPLVGTDVDLPSYSRSQPARNTITLEDGSTVTGPFREPRRGDAPANKGVLVRGALWKNGAEGVYLVSAALLRGPVEQVLAEQAALRQRHDEQTRAAEQARDALARARDEVSARIRELTPISDGQVQITNGLLSLHPETLATLMDLAVAGHAALGRSASLITDPAKD